MTFKGCWELPRIYNVDSPQIFYEGQRCLHIWKFLEMYNAKLILNNIAQW